MRRISICVSLTGLALTLVPLVRAQTPPEARRVQRVDIYHDTSIADPYRWLEAMGDPEVRAWYNAQDAYTRVTLAEVDARAVIHDRLAELVTLESYSTPQRRAGRYFYTYSDGGQSQAALYMLHALDDEHGELLLDPNQLSEHGSALLRTTSPSPDGSHVAYGLSEEGSYWMSLRIRHIETGADSPEVLGGLNSRFGGIAWSADGEGFYYARFKAPERGRELQAAIEDHRVYYHRVGTPQERDELIYERPDHPNWLYAPQVTEDGRYLILTARAGSTIRNRVFYKDLTDPDARVVELIAEDDALYSFIGNDGSLFWFHTDRDAPRGRVIEIDITRPAPELWRELIPERDAAIQYVNLVADRFIVMYAEDARHEVKVFDLHGRHSYDLELPGLGSVWAGFSGRRSDSLAFYRFNGLADPGSVYRLDVRSGKSAIFRRPDLPFDPGDFVTKQVFYRSADGSRIPMFVAYRRGFEPHGESPAFIYAYGAFGWSATPWYQPHWLVWMEMGGVYALPNVRGGGEYGEEWHRAGIKSNKKNTVNDYIAAAEWLVREGYAARGRIVANGGSASAPLAATALIRRPDLFGAGLLDVPTLDMLRFVEWTGGRRLIPEYGDPNNPQELDALLDFSAYHNLEAGECYPATLIAASERDEVAPPAHAYKFTAAMQHAQGCDNPVLLRLARRTGHSIGATPGERVEGWADELAFLVMSLTIDIGDLAHIRNEGDLSDGDRAALAALRQGYTTAWEAGDTIAILATFAEDAALVPHVGAPQASGREAIRRHFWPADAPPGRVNSFELRAEQVRGTGSLAFERGRYELEYEVSGSPPFRVAGNYVAVSRKDDEGRWRWVLYTWNHPPPGS